MRSADVDALGSIADLLAENWTTHRWPQLADALESLGRTLESPDATGLRDHPAKKIPAHDWQRVVDYGHAHDREALVATAARGSMDDIRVRVTQMNAWPPDPRISRGLAAWLLDLPFRATSSQPVWNQIFDMIVVSADERVQAMLAETQQPGWSWP